MTRANLKTITREDIEAAIVEYDEIGRDAFLERYACRPSTRFFVMGDEAGDSDNPPLYDSKPLVCCAGRHSSIGRALTPNEFSGGVARLGAFYRARGFTLVDTKAAPMLRVVGE